MKNLIVLFVVLSCASVANAQQRQYPLNRSPAQKQADYLRSRQVSPYVPPTVTFRQPFYGGYRYGYGHRQRYPYVGYPYGPYIYPYGAYYGGYGLPSYGVYPTYQTWLLSPYPFQLR